MNTFLLLVIFGVVIPWWALDGIGRNAERDIVLRAVADIVEGRRG